MPLTSKETIEKIQKRSLRLAVLGSGYVGLPTVALFAETGFKVIAVDLKREAVKAINSGLRPVNERVSANWSNEMLKLVG